MKKVNGSRRYLSFFTKLVKKYLINLVFVAILDLKIFLDIVYLFITKFAIIVMVKLQKYFSLNRKQDLKKRSLAPYLYTIVNSDILIKFGLTDQFKSYLKQIVLSCTVFPRHRFNKE